MARLTAKQYAKWLGRARRCTVSTRILGARFRSLSAGQAKLGAVPEELSPFPRGDPRQKVETVLVQLHLCEYSLHFHFCIREEINLALANDAGCPGSPRPVIERLQGWLLQSGPTHQLKSEDSDPEGETEDRIIFARQWRIGEAAPASLVAII